MIIAVDCRMIDSSGIGVYLRGILPCLLKSEHSFLLAGDPAKLNSFTAKNVSVIPYTAKAFSPGELFPFFSKPVRRINRADVFFSPFFNIPAGIKIPVFSAIHDIIFPDMPELVSKTGLAVRMWFYRRAYRISKKVFTVSEFSKSRIEKHLGKSKPVIVTHSAIGPQFLEYRAENPAVKKSETLVYIGNIKKHKGLDFLLEAFLLAKKEGLPHRLFIIGERENFRTADNEVLKKIDSLGGNSVSFTGFVSDDQLMDHLARAALLVQPSLYEGFGLPPLEAMVLGTRALISDIPVFREIYAGFPVVFFRAGDMNDLKNRLMELLADETAKNGAQLVLSGELAKRYTFEKAASVIMNELDVQAGKVSSDTI